MSNLAWIERYHLFLFDFDGLLVNTEELHYLAYGKMCQERQIALEWSFAQYCRIAHYSAHGLREQLYLQYPDLYRQEPIWEVLYQEKQQWVLKLLQEGAVQLMPGVAELLKGLSQAKIPCCVVTHSPNDLVEAVRNQHPLLNSIGHWLTRDHYTHPKPHPECYLKAIDTLAGPQDRIIGFEDTPRGLKALMATRAEATLICSVDYPEIADFVAQGARHYSSLSSI